MIEHYDMRDAPGLHIEVLPHEVRWMDVSYYELPKTIDGHYLRPGDCVSHDGRRGPSTVASMRLDEHGWKVDLRNGHDLLRNVDPRGLSSEQDSLERVYEDAASGAIGVEKFKERAVALARNERNEKE